jgi:multiple sugar transport system substrate-binding protein
MFARNYFFIIMLFIAGLLPAACANPPPPVNPAVSPSSTPASTTSDLARLALPYQNVVLHGISENTPASVYIKQVLAPAFERETGIKVNLEITSYDDMYARPIHDMEAGAGEFDFIYIEQDFIYGYLDRNFLVNLSQLLTEKPNLSLPAFNAIDFTSFINEFKDPTTGDLYGVPIEAFLKVYLYRKDLFEDPAIQQAFMETYNYPLAPAVTVDQYLDIAKFFFNHGRANHLELWGTTLQGDINHPASTYEFVETIAPAFGVYNWGINLANYKATVANGGQLNSRQAKEALVFMVELFKYSPPEAIRSTWDGANQSFASGRVAQSLIYGENAAWIATDSTRSQVVGKVGVALPPTASGVIEDALTGKGYIGYYDGGAFGIPYSSKHREAAILWLQYLGQPTIQPEWATASSRVVHLSTFDNPLVRAQDKKLNGYYTLMKDQGRLFAGAPPFPFHVEIRDVIAPYLHQAILGQLTPSEALDQAAFAVDTALIQLGYGK